MIQRIQTVFLALAALAGFSLFLTPMDFALLNDASGVDAQSILSDGVFDINDNIAMTVLTVIVGLLPLVAIFLFKNRKLQSKLTKTGLFVALAFVAVAAFFFYQAYQPLMDTKQVQLGAGIAAPVLSLIFLAFANKYIQKDEKLVRSADRLR